MLASVPDIENQLEQGKYKRDCIARCNLPLYKCNFVFDLSFWSNGIYYMQTLICAFFHPTSQISFKNDYK